MDVRLSTKLTDSRGAECSLAFPAPPTRSLVRCCTRDTQRKQEAGRDQFCFSKFCAISDNDLVSRARQGVADEDALEYY